MKSALELAMERFGGSDDDKVYSPEQKEAFAEVDRKAEAQIAQIKIRTNTKMATIDPAERQQLELELALELRGINEKREREKNKLREQFDRETK